MNIEYVENSNLANCDGYKFRKDVNNGYWLCSTIHKRLHTYIWEKYNGTVPKGYEIHHKDHNKDNNDISNLELLTISEHRKLHGKALTDEQRQVLRYNMINKAIPMAAKKRKENYNHEIYVKLGYLGQEALVEHDFVCECCGKHFKSKQVRSRFCSNKCKSQWRRDNHLDDVERICPICDKHFMINKYKRCITCSKKCLKLYSEGAYENS